MFDEETLELIARTRILEHFMLNKVPNGPWRLVGTASPISLVTIATGESPQEVVRKAMVRFLRDQRILIPHELR